MQRVRVTSPQTRLAQRRGADAMGRLSHLAGRPPMPSTAIDLEAAERALRRQRRLAVRTALALLAALATLLTAAALVPGRLGWAVLFFAPYPVLLALAALHVRRAERVEDDHASEAHASEAPAADAATGRASDLRADPAPDGP
ncbi:Uncharacterized membrane protein, DUF485 family [Glycomyces sambucus]|uniref:Uncharacterized membrane protein, DUF485 family n=1 Tax=Glycomyces sambucus TaxID=380244 RepID=A0A1G9MLB1_9ACTN|nr:hypothetical protein [Glycomyces sambucus]SDL74999.1 Uncharacterized membrane protein, DUF485 family [Glycomyces sambucus]